MMLGAGWGGVDYCVPCIGPRLCNGDASLVCVLDNLDGEDGREGEERR